MRYRFIEEHRSRWPVALQCEVLRVSRSGFYAWQHRRPARRREGDQRVSERIRAIFAESRRTYGSPRVHATLQQAGVAVRISMCRARPAGERSAASLATAGAQIAMISPRGHRRPRQCRR